jgi:hypothetical protein
MKKFIYYLCPKLNNLLMELRKMKAPRIFTPEARAAVLTRKLVRQAEREEDTRIRQTFAAGMRTMTRKIEERVGRGELPEKCAQIARYMIGEGPFPIPTKELTAFYESMRQDAIRAAGLDQK